MKKDPHRPENALPAFGYKEEDETFLETLNSYLESFHFEQEPVPRSELPIIYITGMSRCGSTLLSQLISKHLDVGYINNLIARFWKRPDVGIKLSKILLGDHPDPGAFESCHGRTNTVAGPHEFGYFWRHWLGYDRNRTHNPSDQELQTLDKQGLRGTLERRILGAFGKPTLFKALPVGFAARYLTEVHKRSLFIFLQRDPLDMTRSMLKCRLERYGAYEAWFSVKPKAWPFATDNPGKEVALQVKHTLLELEEELQCPSVYCLPLTYEEVCLNPLGTLGKVRDTLSLWGEPPAIKKGNVPILRPRGEKRLSAYLEEGIQQVF